MKCLHCGSENADNIKFCTNCGAPLANAANQNMQGQANFNQQNQFHEQPQFNPQNQFNGQPQFNPQNQFNGQPQFNPQNQFNGQPQFNPQNQFHGQPQFNPQNQFSGQPGGMPPMTKAQFYKHPALKKYRTSISSAAILLYISAGFTLISIMLTGNLYTLLDIMLLVGLALGIHLGKAALCAVIVCIYSVINTIFMSITMGTPGGILVILASIQAVYSTFKYQSAWKKYQQTGMLPTL